MPDCPDCGRHLVRRHRLIHQKLLYSEAFHCKECERPAYRLRRALRFNGMFAWSPFTRCPKCGNGDVQHVAPQGRAAASTRGLSRLQRLIGTRLYRCVDCHLQYRDWRAHPLR
jgi:DNA-directed RNA polymerase subunit M/transcription elongation factor TFIIS